MTSREIKAKVERSSLGTKSAKAARRSVSNATSRTIVARAEKQWTSKELGGKKIWGVIGLPALIPRHQSGPTGAGCGVSQKVRLLNSQKRIEEPSRVATRRLLDKRLPED